MKIITPEKPCFRKFLTDCVRVLRHYHNPGMPLAGAESEWFIGTMKIRRTHQVVSDSPGSVIPDINDLSKEKIMKYRKVVALTETDLQRKHTRISEIREIVGIFEMDIEELQNSPLKIKVIQILNASGDCYIGIANLMVKGKGCSDFYRSMHPQKTREEALDDAVDGFFAYLSDESEIREVKNW